ncbi:MAG: AAA family ATPase [Thermoguttaceae bacterium]|nr:AAA family ATPase [Thermoguttaceae bacterium]
MKIMKLNVQGYRSLKNVEWAPADLNVVIGPNGSGKSNLLSVLELFSRCARRPGPACSERRRPGAAALGWARRRTEAWRQDVAAASVSR